MSSQPLPDLALLSSEYRAQFLLDLSKAANSSLELPEVLEALSALLKPRINFDAIGLLVIEGGYLRLHSLFVDQVPRNPGESLASLVARSRALRRQPGSSSPLLVQFRIEDSCLVELASTRRAYVCDDLEAGRRFPEEDHLWKHGFYSYVSLPLLRRGELIGAVHFVREQARCVDPDALQLLEDASIVISSAVCNALAYEEIKSLEERLKDENRVLQDEIEQGSMYEEIVGSSPPLARVLANVEKVAPTDSTVLLTGETGTGKELVARAIHRRSSRANRALVKVNCAALPSELIASELFGHEKGAFTGALQQRIGRFETADGGTIFLDEIGELAPDMQVSLLRVLQEREFERVGGNRTIHTNVRVIAATNRDLAREVADGHFRSDLFYRLNVFPLHCPPLRERPDDIPVLVEYFVARYAGRMGKRIDHIDNRTFDYLRSYSWPGNIRELQNVIERAVILAEGRALRLEPGALVPQQSAAASPADDRRERRAQIEAALKQTGGRVSGSRGAAARLGIAASTLESQIRALRIDKHQFRWR